MTTAEHLLTIDEAAKQFRISRSWLYKLVERRDVGAYRVGRRLLFDPDELYAKIIDAGRIEPEHTRG